MGWGFCIQRPCVRMLGCFLIPPPPLPPLHWQDAYGAIVVATELAKALNCGVNDLPLSLDLSWFEQKVRAHSTRSARGARRACCVCVRPPAPPSAFHSAPTVGPCGARTAACTAGRGAAPRGGPPLPPLRGTTAACFNCLHCPAPPDCAPPPRPRPSLCC